MTAFWQDKSLHELSQTEWESLCDGCGKCCLHKLQDEDDGEVYYTDVACRYLDRHSGRCQDYTNRLKNVPACLNLTLANLGDCDWLPATCAYRLVAEGEPLPYWHPLVSGTSLHMHRAGMSVVGQSTISEADVHEDEFEQRIVHWVDG